MNKSELVNAMSVKSRLSKKDCEAAMDAFIATIKDALNNGEKVQLVGFGAFEVKDRAARTVRNPRTNEPVIIPATKLPTFKPGKALKDTVF